MLTRRELLLAATPAFAQETITFSTEVKVVNVFATAREKNGTYRRDLNKEDFELLENGRPQAIRYFSRETDIPLILGLMVDTSMSQAKVLDAERGACFRFLDRVLRERQDQVFIMQFDMGAILVQGLTANRNQLDEALAQVNTPSRRDYSVPTTRGTILYDAAVKACREVMANERGRKAFILLSDGIDVGSQAEMTDAIEAAQRSDTLIYSIYFTDPGFPTGGRDGRRVLARMSQETGGSYFEVNKKLNIQQCFDQIQDELRNQYSIGFVSDEPVRFIGFRKLQLRAKQAGIAVQARDRYWAQP